jgi:hypothetical protein
MKLMKKHYYLLGALCVLVILTALLFLSGYFQQQSIECESDSDCVLGLRLDKCCACPEAFSILEINADPNIVLYEEGKDYSDLRKIDCKNVQCAPCPPIQQIKVACKNKRCITVLQQPGKLKTVPKDLVITLENRGSYYPKYQTLKIMANGTVTYEEGFYAGENAGQLIKKSGKITKEELEKIFASFYENDFFSLETAYSNPDVYDASTTTITIKFNGKTYSVSDYAGAAPKRFWNIVEELGKVKALITSKE